MRLARVLTALRDTAVATPDLTLTLCVVDDGSEPSYATDYGIDRLAIMAPHQGREGFWHTVTRLWRLAQPLEADYYIMLPDDVEPATPLWLRHAVNHWEAITDPRKICLNLLVERSRHYGPCWTATLPEPRRFGPYAMYRTQWVDGCFLAERRFFEVLGWRVERVPREWWHRGAQSSGVGAQLSKRLHAARYGLYQMRWTLFRHGTHPSVMHPVWREKEPLHA